jgi:hypothetical protein
MAKWFSVYAGKAADLTFNVYRRYSCILGVIYFFWGVGFSYVKFGVENSRKSQYCRVNGFWLYLLNASKRFPQKKA